jgi:hypothetical protein
MSTYGLAHSRRGFVLVSPEAVLIARAAPSKAAVEAMLAARAPPLRLAIAERIFRDAPEVEPVLKRYALLIAPDGLLEALQAASALRRSPCRTAALLARLPFLAWFQCDLRTTSPGSDRQIELF